MLYLNNNLLTSEQIIAWVKNHLELLKKNEPEDSKSPSQLNQFKNKLKKNFFEKISKNIPDKNLLDVLAKDKRFTSNYPKLKQVLNTIFSSNDAVAINTKLQNIQGTDWDTSNAIEQFNTLNNLYKYFNNVSDDTQQLFTQLAIACRTQIVLFEENNTHEDTMAYNYAYKLMALFYNPNDPKPFDTIAKNTFKLMNTIEHDKKHPFHEALLVKLIPLPNGNDVSDKPGWTALIQQEGIKALSIFPWAKQIEDKIAEQNKKPQRAPKNMKEAESIAALCEYKNAVNDPEFAKLCHRYKVPQESFDQCLNYLAESPGWPKKTFDSIPDVTIKGEGDAEGLYWVKLPITDKRALILGEITDCCQSIGGHSEECVKNAVSLTNNGLYVLVKAKRKNSDVNTLIKNGEINEQDFKIIGQSYAWKSLTGNLCLDSLECLNGEVPDKALHDILSSFANQVLHQNPDIKFVTLGCGGKTPQGLFSVNATIPEAMLQGFSYGDADTQYCIAQTSLTLDKTNHEILQNIFPNASQYAIDYLSAYCGNPDDNPFFKILKKVYFPANTAGVHCKLLKDKDHDKIIKALIMMMTTIVLFEGEQAQANFEALEKNKNLLDVALALPILKTAGLLEGEQAQANFEALIKHEEPYYLANTFSNYKTEGWFEGEHDQTMFEALGKHKNLQEFNGALFRIINNGFDAHTYAKDNFAALLKHEAPNQVSSALHILKINGMLQGVQAKTYFERLVKHKNPSNLANALSDLKKQELLESEQGQVDLDALVRHKVPTDVVNAFSILKTAGLLAGTQAQINRNAVITHNNPIDVAKALSILKTAGLLEGKQAQANHDAVVKHENPLSIANALSTLKKADLLEEEQAKTNYYDAVIKHVYPPSIADALSTLKTAGLLEGEQAKTNYDAVIKNENPRHVAQALSTLKTAGLLEGEQAQAYHDAVIKHKDPYYLAKALSAVKAAGFLKGEKAQTNRDAVIKHNCQYVSRAISRLKTTDLLKGENAQANFDALLEHEDLGHINEVLNTISDTSLLKGEHAQANFKALLEHENSTQIYKAISKLKTAGLLKGQHAQANFKALLEHPKIDALNTTLNKSTFPLSQESFNALLDTFSSERASTAKNQISTQNNTVDQNITIVYKKILQEQIDINPNDNQIKPNTK